MEEDALRSKLALLPDQPGVYLMKDAQGKIIYVGKAIRLKNRVRSYFQSSRGHSPKVAAMTARIRDLETIVTGSEVEALILECNLIKKYRPKYNISLRDDKTYPYVRVTLAEPYPRVFVARKVVKDGSRYFGPYTNAGAVHETLRLLKKMFPLRSCRRLDAARPCLEYHIKRCLAPCAGKVSEAEYREMIKRVCLFLEGRSDAVASGLREAMERAADNLQFETAAKLRDQLAAVNRIGEKQSIVTGAGDQDAVGMARSADGVCMQVFFIRSGKMVGRDHFLLTGGADESDAAVLAAFLKQYYNQATFLPREILLPFMPDESALLAAWLTEKKGAKVRVEAPRRGVKKDVVAMAADNAALVLGEQAEKLKADEARTVGAAAELGRYLGMERPPRRMECFDISHIQGAETVASMVVFEDGAPNKDAYRRYKLRTVEGKPDDFRSMQEVVGRRYADPSQPRPDLIIIDGGKGQLSSALAVIRRTPAAGATVIGLAKEFEHVFREGTGEPLVLPRHSQALYLLQRIRDEAHRFAVSYHRSLRRKRNMASVLDHIPGIGPKRRQALWNAFGSLAGIKAADVAELAAVPGLNAASARAVHDFFAAARRSPEKS